MGDIVCEVFEIDDWCDFVIKCFLLIYVCFGVFVFGVNVDVNVVGVGCMVVLDVWFFDLFFCVICD